MTETRATPRTLTRQGEHRRRRREAGVCVDCAAGPDPLPDGSKPARCSTCAAQENQRRRTARREARAPAAAWRCPEHPRRRPFVSPEDPAVLVCAGRARGSLGQCPRRSDR